MKTSQRALMYFSALLVTAGCSKSISSQMMQLYWMGRTEHKEAA